MRLPWPFEGVGDAIDDAIDHLKDWVHDRLDPVWRAIDGVKDWVRDQGYVPSGWVRDRISDAVSGFWSAIHNLEGWVNQKWADLSSWFDQKWNDFWAYLNQKWADFSAWADQKWADFWSFLDQRWLDFQTWVNQELAARIPGWLSDPVTYISLKLLEIFARALGLEGTTWWDVVNHLIGNWIIETIMPWLEDYQEGYEAGWESIGDTEA